MKQKNFYDTFDYAFCDSIIKKGKQLLIPLKINIFKSSNQVLARYEVKD